jgi:hypothetical protein
MNSKKTGYWSKSPEKKRAFFSLFRHVIEAEVEALRREGRTDDDIKTFRHFRAVGEGSRLRAEVELLAEGVLSPHGLKACGGAAAL